MKKILTLLIAAFISISFIFSQNPWEVVPRPGSNEVGRTEKTLTFVDGASIQYSIAIPSGYYVVGWECPIRLDSSYGTPFQFKFDKESAAMTLRGYCYDGISEYEPLVLDILVRAYGTSGGGTGGGRPTQGKPSNDTTGSTTDLINGMHKYFGIAQHCYPENPQTVKFYRVIFHWTCSSFASIFKPPVYINLASNQKKLVCANELVKYEFSSDDNRFGTIQWRGVRNATFVSAQGKTATFKAIGNGYMEVEASSHHSSLGAGYTYSSGNKVWVGPPGSSSISTYVGSNNNAIFYLYQPDRNEATAYWNGRSDIPTGYSWQVRGFQVNPMYTSLEGNTVRFMNDPSNPLSSSDNRTMLFVRAKNRCGNGDWTNPREISISREQGSGGGNPGGPGGPILTRSIGHEKAITFIKTLNIYSITGQLVYKLKDIYNFDINETDLIPGAYILEQIDENGEKTQVKVLKNK